MRNIVFFGNCYAATLEGVYSASLAPLNGDKAAYVSCYDDSNKLDSVRKIADADIIVAQVFDVGQTFNLDLSSTNAKIIPFPTVSLGFLWPFGGVAHVRNAALDYWQCGPYDYLMGDNFLNRKFSEGVSADAAVDEYLNLDIAKATHLDRLREIVIGRQRSRDERCNMHFADDMDAHFQSEHIFFNHYRPTTRLASSLARQVYCRLDVSDAAIDELVSRWKKTPFERTALPIHPGVASHFGLAYGHADHRYPYHTGELLTFEEFARRYASFTWNEPLLKGVATYFWPGAQVFREFQGDVLNERVQEAIVDLKLGLSRSRGSSLGERALATLLLKQGHERQALAALERAVSFDPDDAEAHEILARHLEWLGLLIEAEASFRTAVRLDPAIDSANAGLAALLTRQGKLEEAIPFQRAATQIRSGNGIYYYDLGVIYLRRKELKDAEAALIRASSLLPSHARPRVRLAELSIANAKVDEADRFLDEAAELQANDREVQDEVVRVRERLRLSRAVSA